MTPQDNNASTLPEAARLYHLIDRQFSSIGLHTIDTLDLGAGMSVLDVGCGAGQTLPQIAIRVGALGRVTGVDIVPELVEIAQGRCGAAPHVDVQCCDALALDIPDASLDRVFSRFGVMGFDDPQVAFQTFRRWLRPTGGIAFCCWRGLSENELDHFALRVTGQDHGVRPAPFRFADPAYLRDVLEKAGFTDIVITAHDEDVSCGGIDETAEVLLGVGALGQKVRTTVGLRSEVEPALRAALVKRGGTPLALKAAVWIVSARAG